MIRFLMSAFALLILLLGILALISPIPIGILLIALGLSILVCVNQRCRDLVKQLRHRHQKLDRGVMALEVRLNNKIQVLSNALLETRPSDKIGKDDSFL